MGVLTCSRNGCQNIMCDTHVSGVGYICDECKEDFKQYLAANLIGVSDDENVMIELKKFMKTYKGAFREDNTTLIDDFFGKHKLY